MQKNLSFGQRIANELKEWGIVILCLSLFFGLAGRHSEVPTGSMIPNLLPGDRVWVSTLHYGSRVPAHLSLPVVQQHIPLTKIPSYLVWPRWNPTFRLPGFGQIRRGDVVVFNNHDLPEEQHLPVEQRDYYVKRFVALPGDCFEMRDGEVYVNGQHWEGGRKGQYLYEVTTNYLFPKQLFKYHGITKYRANERGNYEVHATCQIAEKLRESQAVQEVKRVIKGRLAPEEKEFWFACKLGGNRDQLPSFRVPKRGMRVTMHPRHVQQYADVIRLHEGHEKVEVIDEELWVDGQLQKEYCFKYSYYMGKGDNDGTSKDSRAFGPIPEYAVVGKAVMILCSSEEPNKWWLLQLLQGKVRWGRTLRWIT